MSTGNDQRPGDALDTFASILAGCRPLFPPALLDSAGWERLLGRAAAPLRGRGRFVCRIASEVEGRGRARHAEIDGPEVNGE